MLFSLGEESLDSPSLHYFFSFPLAHRSWVNVEPSGTKKDFNKIARSNTDSSQTHNPTISETQ